MKKILFALMFLLITTSLFATTNCLNYVGNALQANGSSGVDSLIVLPDANGKLTNTLILTINRDNQEDTDSYISKVTINKNSDNDNVSFDIQTQSLLELLGVTLDNNSTASSFVKDFFNFHVAGFTDVFNSYIIKDSYVWLKNDNDFAFLKFSNLAILDIAIADNDNSKFYVLTFSKDNQTYQIYEVNGDLTSKTLKYSLNAGLQYGFGQLFYDVDDEDGAEVDLFVSVQQDNNTSNKLIVFTENNGTLDFTNPDENGLQSFNQDADKINFYLATYKTCVDNNSVDYDIFKYDFDSIGIYKDSDETNGEELVSTLQLWDPSYASIVGNVAYITHYGGGVQAVDLSNPETIDNTSIIGDSNDEFYGLPQQVKPFVLDGDLYIAVAGGWAGLGVFKVNDCYTNFNLDNIFKKDVCGEYSPPPTDNNTGGDNGTCDMSGACFGAGDVDMLSSGWNLVGTGCPINDMSIFNSVNSVWKWTGNAWAIYSPLPNIQSILDQYNIPTINIINAKEGFWINK
jgi:hypothetical protein